MSYSTDRVTLEGFATTKRSRDMVLQARAIFYIRTGKLPPAISQGGYNRGGVGASAGTHDKDAFDFRTSGWTSFYQKEWELAMWTVGFADWWRRKSSSWPEHNHAVPKKGDLSTTAHNQAIAFRNKRDGLASNLSYPRIDGYASSTWEGYLAAKKPASGAVFKIKASNGTIVNATQPPYISVYYANLARTKKTRSAHVYVMQLWLARLGYFKGTKDGIWGPDTQKAFDTFRRVKLGWSVADSSGPVGLSSLHWLRLYAKSYRIVKER